MRYISCFLFTIFGSPAFSQQINNSGISLLYPVGYQNIITTDSGRTYKQDAKPGSPFYFRPLEIDFWYPALMPKENSPMHYGDFLKLLEERSNRFQNDTVYKNLTRELLNYIGINLQITDISMLTGMKTGSFKNADIIHQRFPLIIYMCAYNGMSYENINLFELLAAHGNVVACITSVGRYPGNMSTKRADLMEQVYDGSFVIRFLKSRDNVDSAKTGIIGYSWGGLSAVVLAMNCQNVLAVLSLDGSEMHYYGDSKEEDADFDLLRSDSSFKLKNLHASFAYLESGNKESDRDLDSIYNILPLLTGRKSYVHFPNTHHEDFSCLPFLASQVSNTRDTSGYELFCRLSLNYFNQYLKNESDTFSLQVSAIYRKNTGDSLLPSKPVKKNIFILKGKITDITTNEPLAYVNAGVPDKNTGTVSQRDGSFILHINPELKADSLKFSMVGYQAETFPIRSLLKQSQPVRITLKKSVSELKEVTITQKLLPVKTLGNMTESKFLSVGLPLKFLGSEIGIKINLGKNTVLLRKFHFTVSDTRLDTAVFRINIYAFKNGVPSDNIMPKNMLIGVGKKAGRYTIDLSELKLLLKGDILVSIEWIEGFSSGPEKGVMFLSAALLNSATWHRLTSQGEWKKATGLGVGFNLEVQKLPVKLKQQEEE